MAPQFVISSINPRVHQVLCNSPQISSKSSFFSYKSPMKSPWNPISIVWNPLNLLGGDWNHGILTDFHSLHHFSEGLVETINQHINWITINNHQPLITINHEPLMMIINHQHIFVVEITISPRVPSKRRPRSHRHWAKWSQRTTGRARGAQGRFEDEGAKKVVPSGNLT